MARDFVSASSDKIGAPSAAASVYPFTMACWFNSDSSSADPALMSLGNTGSNTAYHVLGLKGSKPGDPIEAFTRSGASFAIARTVAGFSVGSWRHACGVFKLANDRAVFLDGVNKATNSTSLTPSGINGIGIGFIKRLTPSSYMDGRIAEAAIWDVALTDGEVAILGAGFSPLCLTHRLGNLVMYQDLIRPLDRPGIGPSMTATGTAVTNHPRVRMPTGLTPAYLLPIVPKIGEPFCVEAANVWTPTVVTGQEFFVGAKQGEAFSTGPTAGEVNC